MTKPKHVDTDAACDDQQVVEQWLAVRKEEGSRIDPETAEVMWAYAQTLDPYGVDPDLPEECWQVGREYFARSPRGTIWVWFGDLPVETREALWSKHRSSLAFPAGLKERADAIGAFIRAGKIWRA